MSDHLGLCRICGDSYVSNGGDICHVCSKQEQINNSTPPECPDLCPSCGSWRLVCEDVECNLLTCEDCGKTVELGISNDET